MSNQSSNPVHEPRAQEEEVKGSSDRTFGLVFVVFFAVIGLWPLIGAGGVRIWSLVISAVLLVLSMACPSILAPLNRLWMRFGLLLHKITNPLIMGLVFFLAVTPTALYLKIRGHDPLRRKIDKDARSYWIDRAPPGPAPETMKNQF